MELDTTITLIGTRLAKVGTEFVFKGPIVECENCKLKNTCVNLNRGSKYRIVNLRDGVMHECAVHDTGVVAIEVVEAPIKAAIESRKAFNGSRIVFDPPLCQNKDCTQYLLCNPSGMEHGDKCTIIEVVGDADSCPKGYALKIVNLKR